MSGMLDQKYFMSIFQEVMNQGNILHILESNVGVCNVLKKLEKLFKYVLLKKTAFCIGKPLCVDCTCQKKSPLEFPPLAFTAGLSRRERVNMTGGKEPNQANPSAAQFYTDRCYRKQVSSYSCDAAATSSFMWPPPSGPLTMILSN